ncbi:MAG TPA: hypothetical protein V6D03_01565, partial [Candidatus Caenarcaniphilales bacterium]
MNFISQYFWAAPLLLSLIPGTAQAQLELKVAPPAVKLAQAEPVVTDQKIKAALPELEKLAEQTLKKTSV